MLTLTVLFHEASRCLFLLQESDVTNISLPSYLLLLQGSGTWSGQLYNHDVNFSFINFVSRFFANSEKYPMANSAFMLTNEKDLKLLSNDGLTTVASPSVLLTPMTKLAKVLSMVFLSVLFL